MVTVYWAVKGGAGATVVTAADGLVAAAAGTSTLLVDLAGDVPAALGVDAPGEGIAGWLSAGHDVPADALDHLSVAVGPNLAVLPRGPGPLEPARAEVLGELLSATPRHVVVDAGTHPCPVGVTLARRASRSVLVTRACYLALHRHGVPGLAPSEVVLVLEPDRALGSRDVARRFGLPVSTVPVDGAVARAVDAGLLASRLPRSLRRALAGVAA